MWSEADSHLYQALASIAVPLRAEQMAAILTLLPFGPADSGKILDLCCGEGRLTASVLRCFPMWKRWRWMAQPKCAHKPSGVSRNSVGEHAWRQRICLGATGGRRWMASTR